MSQIKLVCYDILYNIHKHTIHGCILTISSAIMLKVNVTKKLVCYDMLYNIHKHTTHMVVY